LNSLFSCTWYGLYFVVIDIFCFVFDLLESCLRFFAKMAFRAMEAGEPDIPRLMEIQFQAFAQEPADRLFNGTDAPENRVKAGERLLNQMRVDPSLHTIKVVYTDAATQTETVVGFCMWHIYAQPRTKEEWMKEHEMMTCNWLPDDGQREKVRIVVLPLFAGRRRMEGNPYALLMYMCVDPAWQRKGAGTMLMRWGMERCDELGIPGYLEASPFGYPLYRSCGFEDYEPLTMKIDGRDVTYPTMLRWPKRKAS
jgi:GNAT superfamily N-acetyltransferase